MIRVADNEFNRERSKCKPDRAPEVETIPAHYFAKPYNPDAAEESDTNEENPEESVVAGGASGETAVV